MAKAQGLVEVWEQEARAKKEAAERKKAKKDAKEEAPDAEDAPVFDDEADDDAPAPVEEKTDVLTHLSTQLTAIAQELNAIRRLLEIRPLGGTGAPLEQNEALSGSIDLDFDAFVDRHKMTEER